jgi:hypothetical protein
VYGASLVISKPMVGKSHTYNSLVSSLIDRV